MCVRLESVGGEMLLWRVYEEGRKGSIEIVGKEERC